MQSLILKYRKVIDKTDASTYNIFYVQFFLIHPCGLLKKN